MGGYRFGEFVLDVDLFALKRGVEPLPMQPKIFDVLRYLVERHGKVVTKAELLQAVWRDEEVYDSVVSWSLSHIRRTIGQRGRRHPIETVPGGYRFVAEVGELGELDASAAIDGNAIAGSGIAANPSEAGAIGENGSGIETVAGPVRPLVGRVQVIAELVQHVEATAAGRGALCVVTGEAGIGKTRCAEELAVRARALGLRVLWGRCPQDLAVPPLWPLASALSVLVREQPALVARARKLITGVGASDASAPEAGGEGRFRLIGEGADLLRELAATRPTLLILDDLHWADSGSLDVLSLLGHELRELPLCVVATLRDGELQPGSARERPLRRLLNHARAIPLGALDTVEVAELAQLIGHHRPSDALAEAMRRAAGGVPLFVHEIVRSLLQQHGQDALAGLSPEQVKPPTLARDLLRVRIQRLPTPTLELLSSAAVIGDSFDLSLLMALVELEPEVLLERLEPALADGQLISDAPNTYRFGHSLFQTVLYDDLPPGQRIATHRKFGTLLLAERREQYVAEAARHLYLALPAGDPLLVMQVACSAGHAAQSVFAHENAIVHYTRALEAQLFAGAVDSALRAKLLLSLCGAQRMAGRTRDALETSARVLELAQQQRMSDIVVRATRLRRPTVAMSMIPDALARVALEVVLDQLPDEASATRVSALSQLACIPPYSSDLSRSKQLSARALELASELADSEPALEAMRARLFSLSGPDDLDELLQLTERMLSAEAQGPAAFHTADARTARYSALIMAGRIADADAVLQQMTAAVSAHHWPEASFFCERLVLQRRFLDGDLEQADQGWKLLHPRAVRAGVSYADMFFGAHVFNLMLERQGPSAVAWSSTFGGGNDVNLTPYTRAGFARQAAEAGEFDIARGQLAALGDLHGFPRDGHYLHLLSNLAACASRVRDEPRCEQLFALLAPYAGLNTPSQMGYYIGSVAHFLGLLAEALGRDTVANDLFERALEHNRAMGYRAGVTRTLLAHGQLLNRLGKSEAARASLVEARDQARALGMNALLQDAQAWLDRPAK